MSSLRKRKGWYSIIGKRPDRGQWTHPLKTKDPVLAKAMLAEWRARHGEQAPSEVVGATWEDALRKFLARVAETASPVTVGCYEGPLRRMFKAWEDIAPDRWTAAMFRLWVQDHPAWKPRTKLLLVGASRRFIRWARKAEWPVGDFVGDFKAPRPVDTVPEAYSKAERDRLLRVARGKDGEKELALALLAGMRLGEVARAEWADLKTRPRPTLRVRAKKGKRERLIPVGPRLLAILRRHRKAGVEGTICERVRSDRLRPIFRRFAKAAGLERVPHLRMGRHTFGTLHVAARADLPTVQDLMGHKTPTMTLRYAHADHTRSGAAMRRC